MGRTFLFLRSFCFCVVVRPRWGRGWGGCACCPQVTLRQAQGSRCGYYFVRPRWGRGRTRHADFDSLCSFGRSSRTSLHLGLALLVWTLRSSVPTLVCVIKNAEPDDGLSIFCVDIIKRFMLCGGCRCCLGGI